MARLERQKAAMVRRLEAWPPEWVERKPAPSEWSALEVLDHLRKTESAVLHSCEKNLASHVHRVTLAARAKTAVLLSFMRLPVKLKVPAPVSFVRPDVVTSLETELGRWSAQRLDLKAYLEACPQADGTVGAIHHPVAGWMNLRATMAFLSVHIRHHEYQLKRLERTHARSRGECGGVEA